MRFSPRLHVRERNPGCLQRFLPLLLCSRAQELGGGAGTGGGGVRNVPSSSGREATLT